MELLQERIRREGRVLPGNIVKVDGFLNHRVDTRLLEDIADEFAKYFDTSKITVVLTAEASGRILVTTMRLMCSGTSTEVPLSSETNRASTPFNASSPLRRRPLATPESLAKVFFKRMTKASSQILSISVPH